MALADLDVLDEWEEDGILPAMGDLGIDHRRRVRDRRDADLKPQRLAVRALARAADADPPGHMTRDDVRGSGGGDRRTDAVGDTRRLMARVRVSLGAVGTGTASLAVRLGSFAHGARQRRGRGDDSQKGEREKAPHARQIGTAGAARPSLVSAITYPERSRIGARVPRSAGPNGPAGSLECTDNSKPSLTIGRLLFPTA